MTQSVWGRVHDRTWPWLGLETLNVPSRYLNEIIWVSREILAREGRDQEDLIQELMNCWYGRGMCTKVFESSKDARCFWER